MMSSGMPSKIGLATVKKIIDEHRGVIEMQSDRGVGTTFVVRLPDRRAAPEGQAET